jgi:hypothetical protein
MQLPPHAQPPPPPEGAEPRNPPLEVDAANSEIRRTTCSELQEGQDGAPSPIARRASNSDPHAEHSYSYSGMGQVYPGATTRRSRRPSSARTARTATG